MKFDFVYLGQTVLKYEVPLEIFVGLNEIYEKRKKELPKANKQLVGKIEDEVSLYYSGPNNDKMHQHCFLPQDILKWFDLNIKSQISYYFFLSFFFSSGLFNSPDAITLFKVST